MTSNIKEINDAIAEIASEITGIKNVYRTPLEKIPGRLPAIVSVYMGFAQNPETNTGSSISYRFNLAVYMTAGNMKNDWEDLVEKAAAIMNYFRDNPGLNDTCYFSQITTGDAFIDERENKTHIGHEFKIEVYREDG